MHIKFYSVILVALLFLTGCSNRMDGSSEQKFEESYKKLKTSLNRADQSKLELALRVIDFSSINEHMKDDKRYKGMSVRAIIMKKLDGKNYNDIKTMAEGYLKEQKQSAIAAKQKDLDELKADIQKRKSLHDTAKWSASDQELFNKKYNDLETGLKAAQNSKDQLDQF